MTTTAAVTETDRKGLSVMIMKLFELWELDTRQQLAFLGLSVSNRSALSHYRAGRPLSADRDKMDRVGMLLGIHKSLGILFPHNPELRYRWIRQPNQAFGGQAPAAVIESQGLIGLAMVRAYLDRKRGE